MPIITELQHEVKTDFSETVKSRRHEKYSKYKRRKKKSTRIDYQHYYSKKKLKRFLGGVNKKMRDIFAIQYELQNNAEVNSLV